MFEFRGRNRVRSVRYSKAIAVVTGRFALPQRENVGEAEQHRHKRGDKGDVSDASRTTSRTKNTMMPAPMPPMSHQKRPPSKPQVRPLESDAALVSVRRSSLLVLMCAVMDHRFGQGTWLEVADADGAVGIEAEDFVEGIDHRRSRRDDRAADDGHLALVNVAAPDGEAAVDDGGDAQHETEHHDDGQTVADAGFRSVELKVVLWAKAETVLSANKAATVRSGAKPQERSLALYFFHTCFLFLFCSGGILPPNHAAHSHTSENVLCAMIAQNEKIRSGRMEA